MKLEPQSAPAETDPLVRADVDVGAEISTHSRLELHRGFRSRFLDGERDVNVYFPAGYGLNSQRSYPVLYMQDGQNLFEGKTSYVPGQSWPMRETADAAIQSGEVEPLIIVGVFNTGDRRIAEYTQ